MTDRFHKLSNLQTHANISINAVNQKLYEHSPLSIFREKYERDFHWKNCIV